MHSGYVLYACDKLMRVMDMFDTPRLFDDKMCTHDKSFVWYLSSVP